MSMSYFASGVFGINLHEIKELKPLIHDIEKAASEFVPDDRCDDCAAYQRVCHIDDQFCARAVSELNAIGIKMPTGVAIHYTGDKEEHAGRCAVAAEQWLIGYGLFKNPWDIPVIMFDESFKRKAEWLTWVAWG